MGQKLSVMVMLANVQYKTVSGRVTTPYPKYEKRYFGNEKSQDKWVIENALAEAKSNGDKLYALTFRDEQRWLAANKKHVLPHASKELAWIYLFGNDYMNLKIA